MREPTFPADSRRHLFCERPSALPHRAFTLIELLVVVAILGILMALLLPAVMAARNAAWRSSCANNLRQAGIAFHLHHDVHRAMPSGWYGFHPANGASDPQGLPGWGWAAQLLPYIEQDALCDSAARLEGAVIDPAYEQSRVAGLAIYRCPADPSDDTLDPTLPFGAESAVASIDMRHPMLMCIYCGGPKPLPLPWEQPGVIQYVPEDTPPGDLPPFEIPQDQLPRVVSRANYVGSFGNADLEACDQLSAGTQCSGNGVLFHNSRLRFHDISDGLTNTILVGERSGETGGSTWVGVIGRGSDAMARIVGGAQDGPNRRTARYEFSSRHPGGANFLLGDASVKFVTDSVETSVYRAMATRADGD